MIYAVNHFMLEFLPFFFLLVFMIAEMGTGVKSFPEHPPENTRFTCVLRIKKFLNFIFFLVSPRLPVRV